MAYQDAILLKFEELPHVLTLGELMRRVMPGVLTALMGLVGGGAAVTGVRQLLGQGKIPLPPRSEVEIYKRLAEEARLLGMVASAFELERMAADPRSVGERLPELGSRITDEMNSVVLMHIPPAKVALYFDTQPFGQEVATTFTSASSDIEEAAKSLAVGRNTACVMHLMRVLEIGLNALSKALNINLTHAGWGPILKKIDAELSRKYTQKPPAWKKDEKFYAECAALLRTVQFAWRNPTMHVTHVYDDEKALEVFQASRAFMRHLASKLTDGMVP